VHGKLSGMHGTPIWRALFGFGSAIMVGYCR
jgi:hypothetical protein